MLFLAFCDVVVTYRQCGCDQEKDPLFLSPLVPCFSPDLYVYLT